MAVKLRLARYGKKKAPFYRIIAIDSRRKREGKCLEELGTYNPLKGTFVQFHEERLQDWINKGATPTLAVERLHKEFKKMNSAA